MSTISYLVNQAARFTTAGRARRAITVHAGSPGAWARKLREHQDAQSGGRVKYGRRES